MECTSQLKAAEPNAATPQIPHPRRHEEAETSDPPPDRQHMVAGFGGDLREIPPDPRLGPPPLACPHTFSPLSQWYSDTTSPWTLDYPPFFAYFEKFLSFFASRVDPTMTDFHRGLNYASPLTILFQRLSVALSDFVLVYAAYRLTKNKSFGVSGRFLVWALVIWSPGLFIVDHLHFHYNGFLIGMLLLFLSCLEEGRDLVGGFIFAALLCFKHLFAVAAPVYFVYLFRHYCRGGLVNGFGRLVLMGGAVVAVFAAAYGPFMYYGQVIVRCLTLYKF